MSHLSRRSFLHSGVGLTTLGAIPGLAQAASANGEPHFVLMLLFTGAVDPLYLFDARRLELTDRGLVTNYFYKNPESSLRLADPTPRLWQGKNGGSTLVTPVVDELASHFATSFSLVNGVVMSQSVSHGQNVQVVFIGATNAGPSFMPKIGEMSKFPLQTVHIGGYGGDDPPPPTNLSSSLRLTRSQIANITADLERQPERSDGDLTRRYLLSRYRQLSQGAGLFAKGINSGLKGIEQVPNLRKAMTTSLFGDGDGELGVQDIDGALALAMQYFRQGVTSTMSILTDTDEFAGIDFDVHDANRAAKQPRAMRFAVKQIKTLLDTLASTPFDEKRSMLDMTTIVVTSEFGRTLRNGVDIEKSGTEHNPYINTVLIGGKGIKPGLVIGGSDLKETDSSGNFLQVSNAHLQVDPGLALPMGLPFDFSSMRPREDLPNKFNLADHLTFNSVINTLMKLYAVNAGSYLKVIGTQEVAPPLDVLLAGQ